MLIHETYTNETEGYIIGDSGYFEPFTDDVGKLFKSLQKEYGKCVSKVYVDDSNDPRKAIPIGWVFEKLTEYSDSKEKYLQSVWVTLHNSRPRTTIHHDYMEL